MAAPRITRAELKQQLERAESPSAPFIIDVRLKYPYEHSALRLPGALRVAPNEPDFSALPRDREIIAYDSDPGELVSSRVVVALIRQGFRARALEGGISAWLAANYPVETKTALKGSAPAPGSLK